MLPVTQTHATEGASAAMAHVSVHEGIQGFSAKLVHKRVRHVLTDQRVTPAPANVHVTTVTEFVPQLVHVVNKNAKT